MYYGWSIQFSGTSKRPSGADLWDFGQSASVNSSNALTISGIQFDSPGFHEVQLSGTYENCSDTISEMIYVYAEPTIDFDYLDGLFCP